MIVAQAIAAMEATGTVALRHDYREQRRRGWLLPAALVGLAAFHAYILADYPAWSRWLTPLIVGLCLLAAGGLVLARVARGQSRVRAWIRPVVPAIVGLLALLVAPTVWAAIPVWNAPGDMLPSAGPSPVEDGPTAPMGSADGHVFRIGRGGLGGANADPKLVEYLLANRGDARFLVATESAGSASPLILATGQPVMSLGGFGRDRILTTEQLANLVAKGVVRFFLLLSPVEQPDQAPQAPGQPAGAPSVAGPEDDASRWVRDTCQPVPRELWQSPSADRDAVAGADSGGSPAPERADQTLYDCAKRRQ